MIWLLAGLAALGCWLISMPGSSRVHLGGKAASAPGQYPASRYRQLLAKYFPNWFAVFAGQQNSREAPVPGTPRHPGKPQGRGVAGQLALTRVIAALQAGMSSEQAWKDAAGITLDQQGLPQHTQLQHLLGSAQAAAEVKAACHLSQRLGLPLAGVLQAQQTALAHEQLSSQERDLALAGPALTAKVLRWLPVSGLGLGALLGADPLGMMLGGGLGTLGLVGGIGLILLGNLWVKQLVLRAHSGQVS